MEFIYLILASVGIMLASLAGVLFISKGLEDFVKKHLNYLVAFASGVFLVVTLNLIIEAFEFAINKTTVVISVIVGFLFFYLLERLYPEVHCHHDDHKCLTDNKKKGARKILIGDALHNVGDGILLAPVFVLDVKLGMIAALGIFIHEFVQEISEFFVLRSAGYSTKRALSLNFLVSASILIGAIGGFYLASFEQLVAPLIGLAAGAFIYILAIDLIPESVKHSHKERKYLNYISWALIGILLITSVNTFAGSQLEKQGLDGHGHLESEHEHDDHDTDEHVHENDHDHEEDEHELELVH